MKNLLLVFLLLVVGIEAQSQQRTKGNNKANLQLKSKKVLRRTAAVIKNAHAVVKQNKVFTGDLSKAVKHQKYARVLYRSGKFGKSIHHSRRARQLAFLAIKANKGKIDPSMELSPEETHKETTISEAELEKELPLEDITDEDIIKASEPDVDIDEKE